MATLSKTKIVFLILLLMGVLMTPGFAQDDTLEVGEQVGTWLKVAFGVPEANDVTFAWVRFALFLLSLVFLSMVIQKVPIFQGKESIAVVVAFIMAFMGIRFTPDPALWVFLLTMPILTMFALLYGIYHAFKTLAAKEKTWLIVLSVFVIIAGAIVRWTIGAAKRIIDAPPSVTPYLAWAEFIVLLLIISGS